MLRSLLSDAVDVRLSLGAQATVVHLALLAECCIVLGALLRDASAERFDLGGERASLSFDVRLEGALLLGVALLQLSFFALSSRFELRAGPLALLHEARTLEFRLALVLRLLALERLGLDLGLGAELVGRGTGFRRDPLGLRFGRGDRGLGLSMRGLALRERLSLGAAPGQLGFPARFIEEPLALGIRSGALRRNVVARTPQNDLRLLRSRRQQFVGASLRLGEHPAALLLGGATQLLSVEVGLRHQSLGVILGNLQALLHSKPEPGVPGGAEFGYLLLQIGDQLPLLVPGMRCLPVRLLQGFEVRLQGRDVTGQRADAFVDLITVVTAERGGELLGWFGHGPSGI